MRRSSWIIGMLAAALLAGCSSFEEMSSALVAPGKYESYSCQQIANEIKAAAARERELKGLIDKAVKDTTGPLVSAVAYDTEYLTTYGELRQLNETAERKRCDPQWQSDGFIR
jgi:hypothetical protein